MDRLGIERRSSARVRVPNGSFPIHPSISFKGEPLTSLDLSTGGCCVKDPLDKMGPNAGNDLKLTLTWPDSQIEVSSRVVARSSDRRHIQFLDLPTARAEQIKHLVAPGVRGQTLRVLADAGEDAPIVHAKEIWNSLQGDNVVIVEHVHQLAHIGMYGVPYTLYRNAWPVRDGNVELSRSEVVSLVLFLYNIPNPSPLLLSLVEIVGNLSMRGAQ